MRPLLAIALLGAVAPMARGQEPGEAARLERLAQSVTIHRDEFGVPHVFGPTDASVVFGFAYARAEDRFERIEDFYVRALGRTSELHGEAGLAWDTLVRALELERRSREEYARCEPQIRALCDAFADGINYYLAQHPEREVRLLARFEPWFPLAGERAMWSLYGFEWNGISMGEILAVDLPGSAASEEKSARAAPAPLEPPRYTLACNEWALGPERTASGRAMLLIDLHVPLDAAYEAHLSSAAGYRISGAVAYGHGILPILGFNEHMAWTFTSNYVDWVDLYELEFDDPDEPLAYRYGDSYRSATEWTDVVRVRVGDGIEPRAVRFVKTHHGPILATRGDKQIAVKIAKLDEGGALSQLYHMGRARSLAEFRGALDENALVNQNLLYADAAGNILYVYNGLMPVRDGSFDWSAPVDGADPRTEWRGVHGLADRPQLLNPKSGFLQNCNSSPFLATDSGNLVPDAFPEYMVGADDRDNLRALNARRLLASRPKFTFDDWTRLPFDTFVLAAEDLLPELSTHAAGDRGAASPEPAAAHPDLAEALERLRRWDRRSRVDSVETTLFMLCHEKLRAAPGRALDAALLESVLRELEARHATWRVPWGEINRLQRPDAAGRFDDERLSLPVAGTAEGGSAFVFHARPTPTTRRRYGVAGHAFVCAVELGEPVRARSIVPFGQSTDPRSAHYADQSPYYATGQLKPAWVAPEELERHLLYAYHPGEEPR